MAGAEFQNALTLSILTQFGQFFVFYCPKFHWLSFPPYYIPLSFCLQDPENAKSVFRAAEKRRRRRISKCSNFVNFDPIWTIFFIVPNCLPPDNFSTIVSLILLPGPTRSKNHFFEIWRSRQTIRPNDPQHKIAPGGLKSLPLRK